PRPKPGRGRSPRPRNPARARPSGRASRTGTPRVVARAPGSCRRDRRFRTWRLPTQTTGETRQPRPIFRPRLWRIPTRLEAGQVFVDLPGRDVLVVPVPLVALHLDEVVDVVLGAAVAERPAEDVVLLELHRRGQQVRRQRLEAAGTQLV